VKLGIVTGIERVDDFVSFFNQVLAQRGMGLLSVPGAALRGAKALLHRDKFLEPFSSGASVGAR
jgi:hypothetical protein